MSYGAGVALQAAVYQRLRADAALADLVGDAIFDAMPVSAPSGIYVSLGPEEVREAGDATARGTRHDFVISVMAGSDSGAGFGAVKAAAAAVSDALEAGGLELSRGRLAGLWFLRASARRMKSGAARQVDLTFRARVDLN
ncbi:MULTISPECIES: DUF3168 domain-containing protein [Paracoccus]|uniref:DUF3168 domain-containing protein n=1 Tax=Paracoccus hibiscisoli TaxID=2023261 RepID=A0A4U0QUZ8_9RHOB|nr:MULTISPECIES: DUF3168 domain-containing protein [Paracoccus]ODT60622.1 MAG: hypothetical protein ABS73_04815 [Paracoccus sp. SCN 68-21]TJZ85937.1 DUF3168 domain-containing protein [Paracoccus hibiscisoli]